VLSADVRCSFEKELNRHLQYLRDVLQAACPMRFAPFSYFCTCWNVRSSASPSVVWDIPIIMRRMRTRFPTWVSIGCAPSFGIVPPSRLVALLGDYTTCRSGEMGQLTGDGLQNGGRVGARG
jgi:hypothetical protein